MAPSCASSTILATLSEPTMATFSATTWNTTSSAKSVASCSQFIHCDPCWSFSQFDSFGVSRSISYFAQQNIWLSSSHSVVLRPSVLGAEEIMNNIQQGLPQWIQKQYRWGLNFPFTLSTAYILPKPTRQFWESTSYCRLSTFLVVKAGWMSCNSIVGNQQASLHNSDAAHRCWSYLGCGAVYFQFTLYRWRRGCTAAGHCRFLQSGFPWTYHQQCGIYGPAFCWYPKMSTWPRPQHYRPQVRTNTMTVSSTLESPQQTTPPYSSQSLSWSYKVSSSSQSVFIGMYQFWTGTRGIHGVTVGSSDVLASCSTSGTYL